MPRQKNSKIYWEGAEPAPQTSYPLIQQISKRHYTPAQGPQRKFWLRLRLLACHMQT